MLILSTKSTRLTFFMVLLVVGSGFRWFPNRISSNGMNIITITTSHTNFGNNRTPPPPTMYVICHVYTVHILTNEECNYILYIQNICICIKLLCVECY